MSARVRRGWIGDPTLADAILDRLVNSAYKGDLRGATHDAPLRRFETPSVADPSYLSFPDANHVGDVRADGVVTICTKTPTAVQLFAANLLSPVGGAPTQVAVGGTMLGPMVLSEVRCSGEGGHHDIAVLVFPAPGR